MIEIRDINYSIYSINLKSTFQTALRSVDSFEEFKVQPTNCPENPTARTLGELAICSFLNVPGKIRAKSEVTIPISKISEIPELVKVRIDSGFNTFLMYQKGEAQ